MPTREPARRKKRRGRPPCEQPATVSPFAKAVRTGRKLRGMTQEELARAAGVAAASVNNIEMGRQDPGLSMAQKLAGVLGLSLDALDA
jgi:transcriptional regulator with XRE-family HTH domain